MRKPFWIPLSLSLLFFSSPLISSAQDTGQVSFSALETLRTLQSATLQTGVKIVKNKRDRIRRNKKRNAPKGRRPGLDPKTRRLAETRAVTNVACSESGNASISGTAKLSSKNPVSVTIDASLALTDCNGLNGTFDLDGVASLNGGIVSFNPTVVGSATAACEVLGKPAVATLEENVAFASSLDLKNKTATATVTGSAVLKCANITLVTCNWDQVSLTDTAALEAGCGLVSN